MITLKSKKIPIIAILTALSLIAFLLESLLPPLFIPGAKLGLGNVFLMLCLIWFSLPEALIMLLAKCILACAFGGLTQLMYSVPAGLVSLLISYVLIKFLSEKLSVLSICALSATLHNLIQLSTFGVITGADVKYYFPFLALAGLVAGIVTGIATFFIIKYVPLETVRKKEK